MLQDFLVGAAASALTGLALWVLLPRGASLTRQMRFTDWEGQPLHDTWTITNASPVAVRIISVTYQSAETYVGDKLHWKALPVGEETHGVELSPHEEQLFYQLTDKLRRWRGFILPPGDTLEATVLNNHDLRIKYRRAGWSGVLERREIQVNGGV